MINTIHTIRDFGVFRSFDWPPALPAFKKYNLIYGWNYSGKTTFSRVLRCFELQKAHDDFQTARVRLNLAGAGEIELASPAAAPVCRVFNSDFVRDNLSFDTGESAPILVLGAEDIAKQQSLKLKREQREKLQQNRDSEAKMLREKAQAMEAAFTDAASNCIKNPLLVPNYDKRRFEPKVKACMDAPERHVLSGRELAEHMSVYQSKEKRAVIEEIAALPTAVTVWSVPTSAVLARVVTANKPISRLQQDPALEQWVKNGRALHEGKARCQFCEQPIPAHLLTDLAGHFSAEYDHLMQQIEVLLAQLKQASREQIDLPPKTAFYPEIAAGLTDVYECLEKHTKDRTAALTQLQNVLKLKQTKAFTVVDDPAVADQADELKVVVEKINGCIRDHNRRTAEFEKKRHDAFTLLEMHHAASFAVKKKYRQHLDESAALKESLHAQEQALHAIDQEIGDLERELSEAAKGAERINELLGMYFGKADLRVSLSPVNRYQITRAGVTAKNLSEGEKTAIAFSYFITRVQDGRQPIDETIVVVDDPISSLDACHVFNTYALVKTQLSGCRQLFVSTHSFEFYNLVREWAADDEKGDFKKPQNQWKKWGIYLLRRLDDGSSSLEAIPLALLKFKSEYHYLFALLYQFDSSGGSIDGLLSLPNVVRRFLEAFAGIMIPLYTGLHGKMARLFPDEVERERVWKFVNHYSHNTTVTRSLTIPDTSECRSVVKSCLNAVRRWDAEYFADLETEIA